MNGNYKVGNIVYIVESNQFIRKCTIGRISGGIYLIRFDEGGAIQVKKHRLFDSREAAEASLPQTIQNKRRLNQYDYMH